MLSPSMSAWPFPLGCRTDDVVALARPHHIQGVPQSCRAVQRRAPADASTTWRYRRRTIACASTSRFDSAAAAPQSTPVDGARPTPALSQYGTFDRAPTSDSRLRHRARARESACSPGWTSRAISDPRRNPADRVSIGPQEPYGSIVAPTVAAAAEISRATSASRVVSPPVAWVVSITWTRPG